MSVWPGRQRFVKRWRAASLKGGACFQDVDGFDACRFHSSRNRIAGSAARARRAPAPDTHHVLQTQEWQGTFRAEFNNGSYSDDDIVDVFTQKLTEPFNLCKNVFLPVGDSHWMRHQLTYGLSTGSTPYIQFLRPIWNAL